MPIYEYVCNKCSSKFELLVSSPSARVRCPSCDSRRVEKQFSLFGMKSGGTFKSSAESGACASCSSPSG